MDEMKIYEESNELHPPIFDQMGRLNPLIEKHLTTIRSSDYKCPKCGSANIEQTCGGSLGKNGNKAWCDDCGWIGIGFECEVDHE